MANALAVLATCLGIALFVYVGSYVLLSANGKYLPGSYGIDGPKYNMWAPLGFHDQVQIMGNDRARSLALTYAPLWGLDRRFWHEDR